MPHYFTREEAEELLPAIRNVLYRIIAHRQQTRELEEERDTLQLKAMGNGHKLQEQITTTQRKLARQLQVLQAALQELQDLGCELKDPDTGLIDFLSLRQGEEVYLCWQLGEERIAFWHPLHTGIAGRQPL